MSPPVSSGEALVTMLPVCGISKQISPLAGGDTIISSTSSADSLLADAMFPGTLRDAREFLMSLELSPKGSNVIPLECRLVSSLKHSETV